MPNLRARFSRLAVIALSALAVLGGPRDARAILITFDSLSIDPTPGGLRVVGSPYSEAGFNFTTLVPRAQPFLVHASNSSDFLGSATLTINFFGDTVQLRRDTAAPFTLNSIALGEVFQVFPAGPRTVTFTGALASGGTAVQSFTLDGTSGLETFAFSGFDDVTLVSWSQGNILTLHQFDNIAIDEGGNGVTPIPEPTSLLLLASGAAGLGLLRLRLKRGK